MTAKPHPTNDASTLDPLASMLEAQMAQLEAEGVPRRHFATAAFSVGLNTWIEDNSARSVAGFLRVLANGLDDAALGEALTAGSA